MKLSRKFVSDYIDLDENLTIKQIAEDMTSVGNEYDSASKLIDCTNLIVGEVLECVDHPDSDHLHVCKVDVKDEILDIVCGAPNCRKGLKVIVALPGAKLPGGEIKKGKIRGVESNGMLCSMAELGLDNKFLEEKDKAGIHELPLDTPVGTDPIVCLGLDDEVVDFELTSNRGDLLSILGMAYELGAIYKKDVKDIDLSHSETTEDVNNLFNLKINTDDCSLFLARRVENVTIKPSPDFIKNRLIASGIRPINNVVDISNYVMLETGQPLHFYDADNLGDTIVVRNANKDEKLVTLDSVERVLSEDDIVISDNEKAVGLAGVMGGLSTEVEENTKNIIIESAIFDRVKVRRTSKRILRSEASNRFEKGLDPKRTYMAMERSCHLLEKYADAKIVGGTVIFDKNDSSEKLIELEVFKVEKVLGIKIDENTIIDILKSLGFTVEKKENLLVTVPSRRLDISIKEDLIEEIGRIYGMDNIKGKLPTFDGKLGTFNKVKRDIRNKMISFGLNETLSYTLIPEQEVYKYTKDSFDRVKLADPMSEDRSTLRYSLIYSLKEVFEYNKARNYKDISIFELGKGFYKRDGIYSEDLKLACLMIGNYSVGLHKQKVDFYVMKGIVEEVLNYLGFERRYSFVVDNNIPDELHPNVSASIIMQGKHVGVIGKLHPNVTKDEIYVFEINLEALLVNRASKMTFKELVKFPSITKDLAFVVDKKVTSETIENVLRKSGGKLLTNIEVFDVYTGENVLDNEKSIAYKLTFQFSDRTLTDEEVSEVFDRMIKDVENKVGAKLRNN